MIGNCNIIFYCQEENTFEGYFKKKSYKSLILECNTKLYNRTYFSNFMNKAESLQVIYGLEEGLLESNFQLKDSDEDIIVDTEFIRYKSKLNVSEIQSIFISYKTNTITYYSGLAGNCDCLIRLRKLLENKTLIANDPATDKFILNKSTFIDISPLIHIHPQKKNQKCLKDVQQILSLVLSLRGKFLSDFKVTIGNECSSCYCYTQLYWWIKQKMSEMRFQKEDMLSYEMISLDKFVSDFLNKDKTYYEEQILAGKEFDGIQFTDENFEIILLPTVDNKLNLVKINEEETQSVRVFETLLRFREKYKLYSQDEKYDFVITKNNKPIKEISQSKFLIEKNTIDMSKYDTNPFFIKEIDKEKHEETTKKVILSESEEFPIGINYISLLMEQNQIGRITITFLDRGNSQGKFEYVAVLNGLQNFSGYGLNKQTAKKECARNTYIFCKKNNIL